MNIVSDLFGEDNLIRKIKQDTMAKAAENGCNCPVCDQNVKIYQRPINSTMARQLIHGYMLYGIGQWFHHSEMNINRSGTGDFAKLENWGLIKGKYHCAGEDGKKTSGLWAITQKGAEFARNEITVPKYAILYNQTLLELTGDQISIKDALGEKFDYLNIMKPINISGVDYGQKTI